MLYTVMVKSVSHEMNRVFSHFVIVKSLCEAVYKIVMYLTKGQHSVRFVILSY